jgi:hypothetical protein
VLFDKVFNVTKADKCYVLICRMVVLCRYVHNHSSLCRAIFCRIRLVQTDRSSCNTHDIAYGMQYRAQTAAAAQQQCSALQDNNSAAHCSSNNSQLRRVLSIKSAAKIVQFEHIHQSLLLRSQTPNKQHTFTSTVFSVCLHITIGYFLTLLKAARRRW